MNTDQLPALCRTVPQITVQFRRHDDSPEEASFSVYESGYSGTDGGGEWVDALKGKLAAALANPLIFDGNQRKEDLAVNVL